MVMIMEKFVQINGVHLKLIPSKGYLYYL